jgi:hypothetical protein
LTAFASLPASNAWPCVVGWTWSRSSVPGVCWNSGKEGRGVTVIDRLNGLLEAEHAGVDTLSRLFPEGFLAQMKTRHVTRAA